jgi:hypothetical protein
MKYNFIPILIAAAVLVIQGCSIFDYTAPDLTIKTPNEGETVSSVFILSGTASDDNVLKSVEYSLDGDDWEDAEGLENWYKIISLSDSGEHYISVKATDYNENISVKLVSFEL